MLNAKLKRAGKGRCERRVWEREGGAEKAVGKECVKKAPVTPTFGTVGEGMQLVTGPPLPQLTAMTT